MPEKYLLYFDDTGSRDPDSNACIPRHDKMDCFGLGGILVKEEDIEAILQKHKSFCAEWNIDYPLHSSKIRGGQGKFGWLKKPENAGLFFPALEEFLLSLPFVGIACVIDRPGYVARYKESYDESLWLLYAPLTIPLAACRRELFDHRLRCVVHLAHEQKISNRRLRSNPQFHRHVARMSAA